MKKYFLILLATVFAATGALAQHSQTKGYYDLLKRTGIFSQATYVDSTSRITFATLDSIPNDSTINGKGTAASPLSVARALPPFVVADSLKLVRINAAGTGVEYAAPSGGGKQAILGSARVAQATTEYFPLQFTDPNTTGVGAGGDPTNGSNNPSYASYMPVAGTLKNLRVRTFNAPASGQTYTFTVHKGGLATSLTATMTSAGNTASDLSNTVTISAGDLVAIKIVTSATAGTCYAVLSYEFVPN